MKELLKTDIGKRFQLARKSTGLTQVEFAKKVGMDDSTIAGIETGRQFPTIPILIVLLDNYNISTNWIINGKGSMYKSPNNIRSVFPHIPQIEDVDEMIEQLQVPVVCFSMITHFLQIKEQYKGFIEKYYEEKKEKINVSS